MSVKVVQNTHTENVLPRLLSKRGLFFWRYMFPPSIHVTAKYHEICNSGTKILLFAEICKSRTIFNPQHHAFIYPTSITRSISHSNNRPQTMQFLSRKQIFWSVNCLCEKVFHKIICLYQKKVVSLHIYFVMQAQSTFFSCPDSTQQAII